jgi:hypothetical protein
MNLKEYMASDDPQMCWRLKSGDLVNLIDEATEEIERLHDVVKTLRWEINSLVWPGIISSGRAAEMEGMTVSEWWAGREEVPGESYTRTKRERANLRTENERLRDAVARKDREIEQVLGKVLGFPAYRDDPKNFPDVSPDDDSVRVGNYTAESLADMAAHDLRQYQEFVGSLPELIRETVKSYRCAAGVLLRTALTPPGGTIINEGDSEVESLCSAIVDRLCKASREMNEKANHGTEGGE